MAKQEKINEAAEEGKGVFSAWREYIIASAVVGASVVCYQYTTRDTEELPVDLPAGMGPSTGKEGEIIFDSAQRCTPEEVSRLFLERELVPGDKYVVHIAQLHSAGTLAETERKTGIAAVIESQKAIESLIVALQKSGKPHTFYTEGFVTSTDSMTLMAAIKRSEQNLREHWGQPQMPLGGTFNALFTLGEQIQGDVATGKSTEMAGGLMLYFVKIHLERELNAFEAQWQKKKAGQAVPDKYEKTFADIAQQGTTFEQVISSLRRRAEPLLNHRLIAGDTIYVWGAAFKMAIEGRIDNLRPAETVKANQRGAQDGLLHVFEGVSDPEKVRRFFLWQEEREDVALQMAIPSAVTESAAYVIYGVAHNYGNNVASLAPPDGIKIGLRRLDPIMSRDSFRQINKYLPPGAERK
jgi:hypothetical protein